MPVFLSAQKTAWNTLFSTFVCVGTMRLTYVVNGNVYYIHIKSIMAIRKPALITSSKGKKKTSSAVAVVVAAAGPPIEACGPRDGAETAASHYTAGCSYL